MRRSLSDWLTDMNLTSVIGKGEADGYIGYEQPYGTSHQALDDNEVFQEIRTSRTLGRAVKLHRQGKSETLDAGLRDPQPK